MRQLQEDIGLGHLTDFERSSETIRQRAESDSASERVCITELCGVKNCSLIRYRNFIVLRLVVCFSCGVFVLSLFEHLFRECLRLISASVFGHVKRLVRLIDQSLSTACAKDRR